MVNTVKEYDDFKTYIISVIGNALGDEMLRVISSYLNRYSLTLDDIFNEPDEIRNALYKLFGDNASRVEQELINALSLPTPINNLTHAIKLSKTYFKVYNTSVDISDILELINIEELKYCKSCGNILEPCRYESMLTGLCYRCYEMQSEIVSEIINEVL